MRIIGDKTFAIETKRLHITPIKKDEASHYLREFDLEVARYLDARPFNTIDSVKVFAGNYEEARLREKHLICSIYDKEKSFTGSIEFHHMDTKRPRINIWIAKEKWQKGYAYEALKGMINFFKAHMQLEGFIYEIDQRNDKGLELSKKLKGKKIDSYEVKRHKGSIAKVNKYFVNLIDDAQEGNSYKKLGK